MKKGEVPVEVALILQLKLLRKISFSYVNNINTHEGGTHLQGFRSGLTRTLKKILPMLQACLTN